MNHGRSHDRRTPSDTTIAISLASAEIGTHHGIHTSGDPRPSDSLVSGPQDSLTSHTLGAQVAWGEPSISAVGAATQYSKSGGSLNQCPRCWPLSSMANLRLSLDETEGLFEPGSARAPGPYLKRLWDLRHFMMTEARGKLASGHSELVLGRGWLVLEPLLYVSVYFVLFGLALRTGRDLKNIDFLSYLVVGKITFQFLNRGILSGAGALRGSPIGTLDFPQATLPLGHMLRGALAYRVEIVVMFAMVMLRGSTPLLQWLLAIPLFFLMFAFALGWSLCLAPAIRRFPDIHPALTHVMRLAFYSSGIIFPVEVILLDADNGLFWLRLYTFANPLFAFVKAQQALTFGYEPVPLEYALGSIAVWSVATLVFGFFWFVKRERA